MTVYLAIAGLCAFSALLLWAAAADIATMEIPDRISIMLAGLYPILALACGQSWQAVAVHLACGAAALLIGFVLFNFGVMGGGDAKVIAAAAIWTGIGPALLQFIFLTAIAGGILTISVIGARAVLRPADSRPRFINRLLQPDEGVPYAVAIAAGGLAALPYLPLWLTARG
jgi:prepilin peptidase CpaA